MADSGAPWRRIRDDIAAGITDGRWPPGSQLPSYRDLAVSWGVGIGPVQRAIRDLRDRGILRGEPGVGVTAIRAPGPGELDGATLDERVTTLERRVERLEQERPPAG